jgi:hypothetical protein
MKIINNDEKQLENNKVNLIKKDGEGGKKE